MTSLVATRAEVCERRILLDGEGEGGTPEELNFAPTAYDDTLSIGHDTPLPGVALADDLNGDPLTFSVSAGPTSGSLDLSSDGTFLYTPDAGFFGSDSFTFDVSDGQESDSGTITIDVLNEPPSPDDLSFSIAHDTVLTNGSVSAEDLDGDPVTFSLASGISAGTLVFHGDDSFTYTPPAGFVSPPGNPVTFQYTATDGLSTSPPATVSIDVTNDAPVAEDDFVDIAILEFPAPIPLYVLENDYDLDGDTLRTQSVSASQQDADIWIDASGTFLWYLPPTIDGDDLSQGATYNPAMEPDNGLIGATAKGAWEDFEDTFDYVVVDPIGATDTGTVFLEAQATPEWSWSLLPGFNEADEIKVDGLPGYGLNIRQTYGANARGRKAPDGTQSWQENKWNFPHAYIDMAGAVKQITSAQDPWVIADVNSIEEKRTPIRLTDTLGEDPFPDADKVILMIGVVEKELGFNKVPAKLDEGNGRRITDATEESTLADKQEAKSEFNTAYVFVDKKLAEELFATGKLTQGQLDSIKQLAQGAGLIWNSLFEQFERYQIGDHVFVFPQAPAP
jgi:hypothetical protein